jgi:hypothetical protein
MNIGIPPLPPNWPYRLPFNYPKFVKDYDPNVHVQVFKTTIRANGEIEDVEIVNLFLPLEILCLISVTITWEITQILLLQNCN